MIDARLEVPNRIRELVVIGINNAEKAFALFFDNVAQSIATDSPESIALLTPLGGWRDAKILSAEGGDV